MTRTQPKTIAALLVGTLGFIGQAQAQGDCLTAFQYPGTAVTPASNGTVTTISTCNFEEEYSAVTGLLAGGNYEFTVSTGSYITVREGTYDGAVVAQGYSPVAVNGATGADLFAHWTVDDQCSTAANCVVTSVQLLLDCEQPAAGYGFSEDCDAGTFTIQLDITSLGDGASVNVSWDVDGTVDELTGVGLGPVALGPFALGTVPVVTVHHETDGMCDLLLGALAPLSNCPIPVVCGAPALQQSYCYQNSDNAHWLYQASGSGTMQLTFTAGSIESATFDHLTIYDGTDATGDQLFNHTQTAQLQLAGLQVNSASGSFYMVMTSDASVSCSSGSQTEWQWNVVCLDCEIPVVGVNVAEDCADGEFTIELDVTSTGSGSTVDIIYSVNGGADVTVDNVTVGMTELGPFAVGSQVAVTVAHESNPICNVPLGTITDSGNCPVAIVCGAPAFEDSYCYVDSDNQSWGYVASGSGTMRITFTAGSIESASFDHLTIYDGPDANGDILFNHTQTSQLQLAGLEYLSTTGAFYMTMTSDGSVSCSSGSQTQWEWNVVCLDCEVPQAGVGVTEDCQTGEFMVNVEVTGTGSGSTIDLVYTVNGEAPITVEDVAVGTTAIGPFLLGDVVAIEAHHESNPLCNIVLGEVTDSGTCPSLIECGTDYNDNYCPGNNEDRRYYYQGTGTYPVGLLINSGSLEACCDRIYVYDGADITAPLLTPVGGVGGVLDGLFYMSTNPEHRLTFRITTDISGSCGTGGYAALDWTVSCLDCTTPEATFAIVQDCANFQYFVDVVVTAMGTDTEMELTNDAGAPVITVNAPGTYQAGPFTSGTPVSLTLVNDANALCNVTSGTLVNPLCPQIVCGAAVIEEEYCYGPNTNEAWAYELPGTVGTLRLTFLRGTIESNTWDRIRIYDGPSNLSPLLFEHNNGTTSNLGPEGSAINSAAAPYYAVDITATGANLYMEMTSDGSVQCSTSGTTYDPFEWIVYCEGCPAPGVTYSLVADCFHREYVAEVVVNTAPPAEGLEIINTETAQTITANATGTYSFGPYPLNDTAAFRLTALDNPACFFLSEPMTYASDSCIIRACGMNHYEYCYGNNEDRWYSFQSADNNPTSITFDQGLMPTGDRIVVYNGRDENSPVLYVGNNAGNLAGFALNSQNAENIITLRIESNGSGSCEDGQVAVPLRWWTWCGPVGVDELGDGGFSIHPNPTNGLLTVTFGGNDRTAVRARVLDMSGRVVMEPGTTMKGGTANTIDLSGLANGQYMLQLIGDEWVRNQRVQVAR